ncbi:hypothetical protein P7K49_039492, partial [Saguinus oedipus]
PAPWCRHGCGSPVAYPCVVRRKRQGRAGSCLLACALPAVGTRGSRNNLTLLAPYRARQASPPVVWLAIPSPERGRSKACTLAPWIRCSASLTR